MDIDEFDESTFASLHRQAADAGFDFTTMAELGDTAEHHRALYELNKTCSSDIPGRGEFYTYTDYVAQRIDVPGYNPNGVILAVHDSRWAGMTATSLHPAKGVAFSEMTGVLRSHRGRGLSLALKLHAIQFVQAAGYRWLVAFHHPGNAAAIGMNRRLGFVDYGR
ncbi:GNAT family N-acetyltransferase [Nocardia sp. NPDC059180]|uniref:GNAT family N-acetyltransferase n=1 Tax=Nocardia sp. NPDC059180 TaxID=3346761 RepID=UPI00369F959C